MLALVESEWQCGESSVVVQFEIHRAGNRFGPVGNCVMAKRKFRVAVFMKGEYLTAVCDKCSATFKVSLADDDIQAATAKAEAQFEKHKCKPLDASQNAVRIVREATEGK